MTLYVFQKTLLYFYLCLQLTHTDTLGDVLMNIGNIYMETDLDKVHAFFFYTQIMQQASHYDCAVI